MSIARRLASQSGLIFLTRLFGAGVVFLAQAGIARFWGAGVLADYLVVIAAVNIVAVVMPLGFETIGTYFAAEYRAHAARGLLAGFMRRAYGHIAITAVLLWFLGPLALPLLGHPGDVLAAHWLPVVIMAVATAVVYCNSALLVGLKRPYAGFFADTLFRPLLIVISLVLAGLALGETARLGWLLWLIALGFALIAAAQFAWVIRAVRTVEDTAEARPGEIGRWWRFALPWVLIALCTDFFFDIDLLLLSGLLSREDLAIFGVATRVFSLVAFGVSAVYAVTLPEMFEASARADHDGFHRQVGDANLVATGTALILLAIVVAGAPLLLALFGPEFAQGTGPLAILCLALLVRALFGPAALVLSIHDHPYATLPAIGLGMAVLVGANLLLVPAHGLMGASLAALIAQSVWSAAMWLTARRLAGVDVSIVPRLRTMAARYLGSAGAR